MNIQCTCGEFHDIPPTGLILVITAYQNGELSQVGGKPMQVESRCMLEAFTEENVANIGQKYPKRKIFA